MSGEKYDKAWYNGTGKAETGGDYVYDEIKRLTSKQLKYIDALMSGAYATRAGAANAAGVAERTVTRWHKEDAFNAYLSARQDELKIVLSDRLLIGASEAYDRMIDILRDAEAGNRDKIRIAEIFFKLIYQQANDDDAKTSGDIIIVNDL